MIETQQRKITISSGKKSLGTCKKESTNKIDIVSRNENLPSVGSKIS